MTIEQYRQRLAELQQKPCKELTLEEALWLLDNCSHDIHEPEFVDRLNTLLGVDVKCRSYSEEQDGGSPKGYHGPPCTGLAGFELSYALCVALGLPTGNFFGRGSNCRYECEQLRAYAQQLETHS